MKLLIGILIAVLSTAYAQEINICEGVPQNTFIRNVGDCRGWFLCTPNGPQGGYCPDPWLFNATTQQCDWEWNVQCFTCPTTVRIVSMPVDGSCVQFIRCIDGRASQHACQSGLHFNPNTELCDLPENVGCEQTFRCPSNIPPGQLVTFRSDTNCSVFVVCNGTTPTTHNCNPALHFDPVSQQCVWPNMTDCPLPPPDNGGGGPTTTPPGGPGGPTTTTQTPFNCPSDGHHPHPSQCDQFIVCAAGTPHFFNCSQGLHFNRSTNQCDLPQNAQCTI